MQTRSRRDLDRRIDNAAAHFGEHAFVHAVTRDGLFARLDPMTLTARHVLDLGTATGDAVAPLEKRFPKSTVHALDRSFAMLSQHKVGWFRRPSRIQADACQLPFADQSIDVVFANLLLPFIDDSERLFVEISRVLSDGGVFAFSTLGPDSFEELRTVWHSIDDGVHVAPFSDMHNIGDGLVRAGLRDPVLDVDRLTVRYNHADALFADLTGTGARNSLADRSRGLTGRGRWQAFTRQLFGDSGPLELELELVYGHAFGGTPRAARGPIAIDPASIGRRR